MIFFASEINHIGISDIRLRNFYSTDLTSGFLKSDHPPFFITYSSPLILNFLINNNKCINFKTS
ncbi:hypothetical protein BpHYR1_054535 [Brachionus plicatilis]|uniref:Uncharacterized protein n=1 Tax=Brachionus plicatilis TaxID=10195 RepID=A0A3M7RFE8_BRAPC|nr:hypothetical protein BpHYR1_054535 [Brachionus plicatilis]